MKPINFLFLSITCLFVACQQNDAPAPNAPCEWAIELVAITQDTCFLPLNDPFGYIIPPIEGYDIDQIALSNIQENILFFLDAKGEEKMADLYQFNLCTNELQLLTTLEYYSNDHLRLNSKDQIIYIRAITPSEKELVFYDINEASITTISASSPYVNEIGWVTDTSFMVEEGINLNTNPSFERVVYNTQNIALDTIYVGSGVFSNPFNDRIAINGFIPGNGHQLFIYDIISQSISETYDIPHEFFFKESYASNWLSDDQLILVRGFEIIGRFHLEDQTTDIFFNRSALECRNVRYRKAGIPLGDGKHFLQIREEFFFNEEGEYRLRNDIIRYNMETGLEELIVLE